MESNSFLPCARTEKLIVRELEDEVLVYDLQRQKAHCLNRTSAFIWKHCDGKTTAGEMRHLLEREFATRVDEDVVWLALSQLRRFHLVEGGKGVGMKVTRRELVRKYLPAALILPVILSLATPAAAQAASGPCAAATGRPNGCPCTGGADCASGCCLPFGAGTCQPTINCA
ncbi:MAG: PqqD family protein [Acidobacteriota bacterium]|nr:PqqD family protein [Acidobacteriota bacterium]